MEGEDQEGEEGRGNEDKDEAVRVEEHQDEAEGDEEHQDKLRKFKDVRQLALSGQEIAANKMTSRAKQLLKPFDVGQNATLKVPEFDRGPCDPRNLLVVVMEANEDMYKLGCREGKLAQRYSTADLDFVEQPLLKICDVPNMEIALRTAVGKTSGGQGYIKCSCKGNCSTHRCSCNKQNMKCNSKCHPGSSCSNIN